MNVSRRVLRAALMIAWYLFCAAVILSMLGVMLVLGL